MTNTVKILVKLSTLQTALHLTAFCATQDKNCPREYLKGVYFELNAEGLKATATNGHVLSSLLSPAGEDIGYDKEKPLNFFLPNALAASVLKWKPSRTESWVEIVINVETTGKEEDWNLKTFHEITLKNGLDNSTITSRNETFNYPDYRRTLPPIEATSIQNASQILNANYLGQLGAAMMKAKIKTQGWAAIQLEYNADPKLPARVKTCVENFEFVILPMNAF